MNTALEAPLQGRAYAALALASQSCEQRDPTQTPRVTATAALSKPLARINQPRISFSSESGRESAVEKIGDLFKRLSSFRRGLVE
jgi:hypothetical protein